MLSALDHVNVRTARLEPMISFYREVLGLEQGERPAFQFGGAWMYCAGRAVVHLVEVAAQPEPGPNLRLEHFAFSATGLSEFVARLKGFGISCEIVVLPRNETRQVNLHDPDGNHIHVDFAAHEPLP